MGQIKDEPKVRRRQIPADARITGPVPQPNPILKWINDNAEKLVGGAETVAGFFDGNPSGELVKAVALIPPGKARAAGEALLKRLKVAGWDDKFMEAFTAAQKKYPRIFGHIGAVGAIPEGQSGASGLQSAYWQSLYNSGYTRNPVLVEELVKEGAKGRAKLYNQASAVRLRQDIPNPSNTVHHELAHVAQQLRDRNFGSNYDRASKLVGYHANPFEARARQAGSRAVLRSPEIESVGTRASRAIKPDYRSMMNQPALGTALSPEERRLEQLMQTLFRSGRNPDIPSQEVLDLEGEVRKLVNWVNLAKGGK